MHGDEWKVLAKELNAALDCVFVSESESAKPHYSGYSFLEALALAASGGTAPLARFVRDRQGRNMLSDRHWQYLAVFIYSLWRPPKHRRGRPKRGPASEGSNAESYAASLVARSQVRWRAQHGRQRVPNDVTNELITRAIAKVAADLEVPERRIRAGNVRNFLKSGRNLAHI